MPATLTPNLSGYFTKDLNPDFLLEIQKGTVPGYTIRRLFGANFALDTTPTTVWPLNGVRWTPLLSDTELFITSNSASDTSGTILIRGLDAEYNEKQEQMLLNGQTPVSMGLWFRINDVFQIDGFPITGDIFIAPDNGWTDGTPNDLSAVQAVIPFDDLFTTSANLAGQLIYTVPAGKTLFLYNIRSAYYQGNVANALSVVFKAQPPNRSPFSIFRFQLPSSANNFRIEGFVSLTEGTTCYMECATAKVTAGDASFSIGIDAILIDNDQF